MSNPFNDWIDARIKVAMDELHQDLQEDIAGVEARLTARIISLPGLLGDQIKNVAVDAEGIANSVAGKLPPLLQTLLNPAQLAQTIAQLLNPAQLAQTIAQSVLQGLPGLGGGLGGILHLDQRGEHGHADNP